jgi:hypothetical protein
VYPYFDIMVMGLAWANGPECCAGRIFHAKWVKGDDPDKKEYPGPPCWGLCLRLTTAHLKKVLF